MLIRSLIFTLAAISTAALSPTTASAQTRPPPQQPNHSPILSVPVHQPVPLHACPAGESWQYGCVQYAPAGPGQLFGACLRSAYSCKRSGGQIQ
jgi:hypothetical protein